MTYVVYCSETLGTNSVCALRRKVNSKKSEEKERNALEILKNFSTNRFAIRKCILDD
jgi:invasion protein IalB